MPSIVGNDAIAARRDGHLENQIILGIDEVRTPEKEDVLPMRGRADVVQNIGDTADRVKRFVALLEFLG
jgi:hypothetical protein